MIIWPWSTSAIRCAKCVAASFKRSSGSVLPTRATTILRKRARVPLKNPWPRLFRGLKRRTKRRSNCVNLKVQRKATVRSMTTSNSAIRILCSSNHFPYAEARAFAPALAPSAPSSPKSLRILAIATLGGLALGVGLGVVTGTPRSGVSDQQASEVAAGDRKRLHAPDT